MGLVGCVKPCVLSKTRLLGLLLLLLWVGGKRDALDSCRECFSVSSFHIAGLGIHHISRSKKVKRKTELAGHGQRETLMTYVTGGVTSVSYNCGGCKTRQTHRTEIEGWSKVSEFKGQGKGGS